VPSSWRARAMSPWGCGWEPALPMLEQCGSTRTQTSRHGRPGRSSCAGRCIAHSLDGDGDVDQLGCRCAAPAVGQARLVRDRALRHSLPAGPSLRCVWRTEWFRPELVISDHCWRKRSPEIRRSRPGGPFRSKSHEQGVPVVDRLADTWPVKCRTVDRNGCSFTFESSFQLNQVQGFPAGRHEPTAATLLPTGA
jgi:hypothetical protein